MFEVAIILVVAFVVLLLLDVPIWLALIPVSYTHLTLPTNREV